MNSTGDNLDWCSDSFLNASKGSEVALAEVLEGVRPYLFAIAQSELNPAIRRKVSESDLVQQTLLEAQQAIKNYEWRTPEDFLAWLRRILLNNLTDQRRRFGNDADGLTGEEISIDGGLKSRLLNELENQRHPLLERLVAEDCAQAVQSAIATLPEEERTALLSRFRDGQNWSAVGQLINKTPEAARKLVFRALEKIREQLVPTDDSGITRRD